MSDILFNSDGWTFSYRVAGICVKNGCVLLQKPKNDDGYAFPGGQVSFGETNDETLKREFAEETGAEVTVGALRWVGEIFFPWGERECHQICLYYNVSIVGELLESDVFHGIERGRNISFYWIPIKEIDKIEVYPTNARELLKKPNEIVEHFIYREK